MLRRESKMAPFHELFRKKIIKERKLAAVSRYEYASFQGIGDRKEQQDSIILQGETASCFSIC